MSNCETLTLGKDTIVNENQQEQADLHILDLITGKDSIGEPACRLLIRIGGSEDTHDIQYDAGPVFFSSRDFGEIFLVDLKFPDLAYQEFRHTLELFEQFVNTIDRTTGEYDPEHMLSAVFMENSEYHHGYLVAQIPVFFAQTSHVFMGKCDTLRIAFIREFLSEIVFPLDGDIDKEEDIIPN